MRGAPLYATVKVIWASGNLDPWVYRGVPTAPLRLCGNALYESFVGLLGDLSEGLRVSFSKETQCPLKGKKVELERGRIELLLAISDTEFNRLLLFWNIERAEEIIPDSEDESVVFVPMAFRFAVMNLMLSGANENRTEEWAIGEPDVRVPEMISREKEEVGGDAESVDGIYRDDWRHEKMSQGIGDAGQYTHN